MEWTFGAGMSYTTFQYDNMTISSERVLNSDTLTVGVTVKNVGSMDGKEVVMLYLIQPFRRLNVPETKMLKRFTKVFLRVGESTRVDFRLNKNDWSVYDPQIGRGFRQVAEPGAYFTAFKFDTDCDVYSKSPFSNSSTPLCRKFMLQ